MPTIITFQGIKIVMRLRGKEHDPPHVHEFYQDFSAPFAIATGEIMSGAFPLRQKTLVKHFILQNQEELEEMWETGQYKKLPPIK